MRPRSKKRQVELDAAPAVRSISDDREPRRPTDESFREFVRRLPCVVCLRPTLGGDPAHHKTKRVAGDWVEVFGLLIGNIYPACREHHVEQHKRGIATFAGDHRLDLVENCRAIGIAYRLGWSPDGLGVAARIVGSYALVRLDDVLDGELPF